MRPGEGGDDAADFADHLADAITAYAARQGWAVGATHDPRARTATLEIAGQDAHERLSQFAGTHRVQRVPTNGGGRRHTSTATIAVLREALAQTITVDDADLRVDRMRGHGRGGQRRNKVETAVRVTHVPSGIVVTRLSGRSQAANLEDAKQKITHQLAEQARAHESATVDAHRRSQVDSERSGKAFTHCWYRDEVVRHADGHRWTIRQWKQGRI